MADRYDNGRANHIILTGPNGVRNHRVTVEEEHRIVSFHFTQSRFSNRFFYLDLAFIKMILKREVGIGQLTDVQTSEIDYITRMKAMPFDLYSKKVTSFESQVNNDLKSTAFRILWEVLVGGMKELSWPQVTYSILDTFKISKFRLGKPVLWNQKGTISSWSRKLCDSFRSKSSRYEIFWNCKKWSTCNKTIINYTQ